jgi:hypothetical protein
MSQARKQRREMAKAFGYTNRSETMSQFRERVRRSSEMGKQFHLLHLERSMNEQLEKTRTLTRKEEEQLLANNTTLETGENLGINQEAFSFLNNLSAPAPEASPSDLGNPESNG